MRKMLTVLFLMMFSLCLVACDASDDEPVVDEQQDAQVEEPNVEEEPLDVDPENEVEPETDGEAAVPHMLGCPCCTSV